MGLKSLMNEITKILIFSRYEDINGRGNTAQEIPDFEQRAIDTYLGKSDGPHKIVFNTFHAKVERDAALIFNAIDRHPNYALDSDNGSQCACMKWEDGLIDSSKCHIHGKTCRR